MPVATEPMPVATEAARSRERAPATILREHVLGELHRVRARIQQVLLALVHRLLAPTGGGGRGIGSGGGIGGGRAGREQSLLWNGEREVETGCTSAACSTGGDLHSAVSLPRDRQRAIDNQPLVVHLLARWAGDRRAVAVRDAAADEDGRKGRGGHTEVT